MLEFESLTGAVIGAAIEVHRELGPGLLESVYQRSMCHELWLRRVPFQSQAPIPVVYKGVELGDDLRIDLLVAGQLVVELKSMDAIHPLHEAQLMTYMKLAQLRVGLLINFNVPVLKDGIRRPIL